MVADQNMWCREETFIVFMYVLRSIVTPWSILRNSRDQNHAHVYFFMFPWLAFVCGFSLLNPPVAYAEKMKKTRSVAILVLYI